MSLWINRHKANHGLQAKQLRRTRRLEGLDLRRRLLLLRPNGRRRLCLLVPPRCREWLAASVTFAESEKRFRVCDFRVSAVTTKQDLEVPVAVNQDEKELLLMKTLENPHIWYDTEFPHEEEAAGMTKQMKSMRDFDVFDEVSVDNVCPEALNSAISAKWVKVRKPDGTARCRIVGRGYTQQVEDKDETFASTRTLRLLLTLAVAKGWHISIGDISTAFFLRHTTS